MVAVVDAYDVIMLEPASETLRRYRILAPDGAVVYGADNAAGNWLVRLYLRSPGRRRWLPRHRFPYFFCWAAPPMPVAPKFGGPGDGTTVNAGTCVGRVATLRRLYARLTAASDADDDQVALNAAAVRLMRERLLVVDRLGDILYTAVCDPCVRTFVTGRCPMRGLDPVTLLHPVTQRRPCVLHMPGSVSMDRVCRLLDLPRGRRRPRVHWMIHHHPWFTMVASLMATALLLVVLRILLRRHRSPATRSV